MHLVWRHAKFRLFYKYYVTRRRNALKIKVLEHKEEFAFENSVLPPSLIGLLVTADRIMGGGEEEREREGKGRERREGVGDVESERERRQESEEWIE